jgi:SAM-dependent methyltransferase
MTDPDDITLASYDAQAQRYIDLSPAASEVTIAFLERVARLVGTGRLLELGSGPGRDADFLARLGVDVLRTDATPAFVDRLRTAGHDARRLDVRTDDFGGPYDAVLANAVLLHLSRVQFEDVIQRVRACVTSRGVFAFTLKQGDGDGWSEVKLGLPRHFTYWRAPAVLEVLARTGWNVISLDQVPGRGEDWLFVLTRARASP